MTDREEYEKAKNIAWDECKFEGEDSFDACPFEMFKKGWQARGELDAVRIKELEAEHNNLKIEYGDVRDSYILYKDKCVELTAKLDKAKEVELNKSLLDKLLPLKLKIIPDNDGDVQYVSCSIRVSICQHKRISSNEYSYKANNMARCSSSTLTGAINEAMKELVEALEELDK